MADDKYVDRVSCGCRLDLTEEEYRTAVETHVNALPEELRAPEDVYRERLEICLDCQYEQNRMCRMCGCFVEIRASRRNMYCPMEPRFWDKV